MGGSGVYLSYVFASVAIWTAIPAVLLLKELLGIEGTRRCCDTDEDWQSKYSEHCCFHGTISTYEESAGQKSRYSGLSRDDIGITADLGLDALRRDFQ
jgi:hypothetical protein